MSENSYAISSVTVPTYVSLPATYDMQEVIHHDLTKQNDTLHDIHGVAIIGCALLAALVVGRLITWAAWGETAGKIHNALGHLKEHARGIDENCDEIVKTSADAAYEGRRIRKILRRHELRDEGTRDVILTAP